MKRLWCLLFGHDWDFRGYHDLDLLLVAFDEGRIPCDRCGKRWVK